MPLAAKCDAAGPHAFFHTPHTHPSHMPFSLSASAYQTNCKTIALHHCIHSHRISLIKKIGKNKNGWPESVLQRQRSHQAHVFSPLFKCAARRRRNSPAKLSCALRRREFQLNFRLCAAVTVFSRDCCHSLEREQVAAAGH